MTFFPHIFGFWLFSSKSDSRNWIKTNTLLLLCNSFLLVLIYARTIPRLLATKLEKRQFFTIFDKSCHFLDFSGILSKTAGIIGFKFHPIVPQDTTRQMVLDLSGFGKT